MIIGQQIVGVRPMTHAEAEREGWLNDIPATVLALDDGTLIYAAQDDEGNGPGSLFGLDPNGSQFHLHYGTLPAVGGDGLPDLPSQHEANVTKLVLAARQARACLDAWSEDLGHHLERASGDDEALKWWTQDDAANAAAMQALDASLKAFTHIR